MDLNELALFIDVVDQKGFTAAAKRLGLPKSNVSRRISHLEDELGVKLLERTSRSVAMTEVGELIYQRCKSNVRELQETEQFIPDLQNKPLGRLRIEVPSDFGSYFMGDVLGEFAAKYPEIQIQCETVTAEGNLIEDKIDLAIRISLGGLPDSSFIARKLAQPTRGIYTSPEYLARKGRPSCVEDLERFDLVEHAVPNAWRFGGDEQPVEYPFKGNICTNNPTIARDITARGVGVAVLPDILCAEAVEQGKLVKLELDEIPVPGEIYAVYASRRHMPVKLRLFLDFINTRVQDDPRMAI